jgi:hypothetical protein
VATFHVWSDEDTVHVRTIAAPSAAAIAKIFCGGQEISSTPPTGRPSKKPACRVQKDQGDGVVHFEEISTPFWRVTDSQTISDEAALPEMPADVEKDYDGSPM